MTPCTVSGSASALSSPSTSASPSRTVTALLLEQRRAHLFEEKRIAAGAVVQPPRQRVGHLAAPRARPRRSRRRRRNRAGSRRTNVVDAGQRPRRRCSARLVTISMSGYERRPVPRRGRKPHAIRYPPSASPRRARASGPTPRQRADGRRERVEQRRLQVFAAQMPRQHVDVALHRQTDAETAAGTARATRSSARIRARRRPSSRQRRMQIETPRTESGRTRRRARRRRTRGTAPCSTRTPRRPAQAFLQARTAAGSCRRPARRRRRPPIRASVGSRAHVRLQRRQLRLTADIRRQSRFASTPPAASRSRSRRGRGTASPAPPANRARRRRTPTCACTGRRDAASPGSPRRRRGPPGPRGDTPAPTARRRCRSGAALRAGVARRLVRRAGPTGRAGRASAGDSRGIERSARARAVRARREPRAARRLRARRHAEQRDDLLADRLVDEAAVLSSDVDRHFADTRDQRDARRAGAMLIDERGIVRHDGDQHRRPAPLCRPTSAAESSIATARPRSTGSSVASADSSAANSDIDAWRSLRRLRERASQDALDRGGHVGMRRRRQHADPRAGSACSTAGASSPSNGRLPASISWRTTPSDQMSERQSTGLAAACSGLMYGDRPHHRPRIDESERR